MLRVKFWRIENVVLMKVLEQGAEIKRGCEKFFVQAGLNWVLIKTSYYT